MTHKRPSISASLGSTSPRLLASLLRGSNEFRREEALGSKLQASADFTISCASPPCEISPDCSQLLTGASRIREGSVQYEPRSERLPEKVVLVEVRAPQNANSSFRRKLLQVQSKVLRKNPISQMLDRPAFVAASARCRQESSRQPSEYQRVFPIGKLNFQQCGNRLASVKSRILAKSHRALNQRRQNIR